MKIIPFEEKLEAYRNRAANSLGRLGNDYKSHLAYCLYSVLDMAEAAAWVGKTYLDQPTPSEPTLRKACQLGRLYGILKSNIYFTNQEALKEYMKAYRPGTKGGRKNNHGVRKTYPT